MSEGSYNHQIGGKCLKMMLKYRETKLSHLLARSREKQQLHGDIVRVQLHRLTPLCCLVVSHSFTTPWTVAHQAPLSMQFSRQEYWSRLPFPSPGNLSNPGIKPMLPALQVDSLPLSHQGSPTNPSRYSLGSEFEFGHLHQAAF